jgi:xanthine dehydrogenase accessory factor
MTTELAEMSVLVRGVGDVGSAVAVVLHRAGYRVAIQEDTAPATIRRGMAFTDVIFDGTATLEGIGARRLGSILELPAALAARSPIAVMTGTLSEVLGAVRWAALVDARLRKRSVPERQCGLAPVTIGLGPNFVAGENVDIAIETRWGDQLGAIIDAGPTLPQ